VIVLVKVYCILKLHRTLNHKVGTVLTDASVHDYSVDLHRVRLLIRGSLVLLALEEPPPCYGLFNMYNSIMKLPNWALFALCIKLSFFIVRLESRFKCAYGGHR
jgi:hypothetical protein